MRRGFKGLAKTEVHDLTGDDLAGALFVHKRLNFATRLMEEVEQPLPGFIDIGYRRITSFHVVPFSVPRVYR